MSDETVHEVSEVVALQIQVASEKLETHMAKMELHRLHSLAARAATMALVEKATSIPAMEQDQYDIKVDGTKITVTGGPDKTTESEN